MMKHFDLELQLASQRLSSLIWANRSLESRVVIARYTAAMAGNFIAWLGMTYPWLRHERAMFVVLDNLRCEMGGDHRGMLLRFSDNCGASPIYGDHQYVATKVNLVWTVLSQPTLAGLRGLAILATLEHLSLTFIPELARRAKECGCTNFNYTNTHGAAGVSHSIALIEAVRDEMVMGYISAETMVHEAMRVAEDLVTNIFS